MTYFLSLLLLPIISPTSIQVIKGPGGDKYIIALLCSNSRHKTMPNTMFFFSTFPTYQVSVHITDFSMGNAYPVECQQRVQL